MLRVLFGDLFAVPMSENHSPLKSALVAVCNDIVVDHIVDGFIAKGAFGHVFEVVDHETAERMALKVFIKEPSDDRFHFWIDCEFRRGRIAFEVFPEHVIPPLRFVVGEHYGAILFAKVGCSLNMTRSKHHRIFYHCSHNYIYADILTVTQKFRTFSNLTTNCILLTSVPFQNLSVFPPDVR